VGDEEEEFSDVADDLTASPPDPPKSSKAGGHPFEEPRFGPELEHFRVPIRFGESDPGSRDFDPAPSAMFPVLAYIDSDDATLVMRFYQQLERLLGEHGVEHEIAKIIRGSIFPSIRSWFRRPANRQAMLNKLNDGIAALEQGAKAHVNMSMAQVDNTIAHTLLSLGQAAGENDYAVCLHGVIAYRITRPDGSKVQTARRLTSREAAILDRRPELLDAPHLLLGALGEIIALEEGLQSRELSDDVRQRPDAEGGHEYS